MITDHTYESPTGGVTHDREGPQATLSLWLPGALRPTGAVRGALAALEEYVDVQTGYQLQLVVTELVTNSLRHSDVGSRGSVGLDVRVTPDRVFVEVSYPGLGFEPEAREATPDDPDRTGGWGLLLVDRLTDSWEVVRDDLTRVRFEMSRAGGGGYRP